LWRHDQIKTVGFKSFSFKNPAEVDVDQPQDAYANLEGFAACSTLFLFLEQIGVRKLEAFLGTLIAVMAIAFARLFIEARPDPVEIAKGKALGNSKF
jgi:hypothetical protein